MINEPKLHVVIPFFNHTNARVSRRNLELCLRHLAITPDCRVVLVEGIWNREAELPDWSDRIFRHLKFDLKSPIWVKENLINLGIDSLEEEWEYAAWIDKDIQFLNPNWSCETIQKLNECDILQPWSRVIFLAANHEVESVEGVTDFQLEGFSFLEDSRGVMSFCNALEFPEKKGHMGYAWAIRKSYYRKLGKLFDGCILGGGDSVLSCSIEVSRGLNPRIEGDLIVHRDFLEQYAERFLNVRTGFVGGTIVHHHHGNLNARQYLDRYLILEKGGYDPSVDLVYAENGTLCLANERLEKSLLDYFYSREEHME